MSCGARTTLERAPFGAHGGRADATSSLSRYIGLPICRFFRSVSRSPKRDKKFVSPLQMVPGGGIGRYYLPFISFFILFSTGGFILVSDYVRMEVTLVGSWWDVVAGDQTGVDFIPMKFCGVPSRLALGVGALSGRGAGALQRHASA